MKPVAAVVAILASILVSMLAALPLAAAAHAAPAHAPPAGPTLDPPVPGPVTLTLAQVAPRLVTVDGPDTLEITGTLVNTGDLPTDDLEIRVQRGGALGTEGALRDALDGGAPTDASTPQFVPLAASLAVGEQLPVRLAVPLRGSPRSGLALSAPGVYELLVNVNGVPRDGARARLAAVRMLLPVLSLPVDPAPARPDGASAASAAPAAPAASAASPFALLYPIADTPRRLSTVPGEPVLLVDDDLAGSLAPEGRLGGLVAALAAAPVGSRVRAATCLAIDPDLVETAAAMRGGYSVLGADGIPGPGAGADVAGRWLDGLVAVARGGCVLALPYADADLVALTRGGLGDLAGVAVTEGRTVLADLLGTPVVPRAVWPADGLADEATLDRVGQADGRALVLSAENVEQGRTQLSNGVVPIAGARVPQFAVLTDPLLARAAAGTVPTPLSTQDAIGALAFRTRGAAPDGGPIVLAPPHQWAADGTGATALLQAVDALFAAGRVSARGLDEVLAASPPGPARPVTYPLQAGGREVAAPVVDAVRATSAALVDLRSAAVEGSGVGVTPDDAFAPLRRGLVRPVSAGWRDRPGDAAAAAAAGARRVDDLRATVRVLEPPSPYSLGTSDAPILVTIGNGLPFTVRVRVDIASTSGLRVAPIETQQVPPLGRRQVKVSAEVTRSGQFTVQASVRSPDGERLGPPSRLRIQSTAYGTISVWLTGSAGVLLVVLAVRRVLRRVRGDPTRPRPDRSHPVPQPRHLPPGHLPPDRPRWGRVPLDPRRVRRDRPGHGDPFPDTPFPNGPSPDTPLPDAARPDVPTDTDRLPRPAPPPMR